MKIKNFIQFTNENYLSGVASELVDKDWDALYAAAQEEPLKSKIKKMLVTIFKDPEVLIRVGDNYEWSDGSNGFINFSNFNHFITDCGYKAYADKPAVLDNVEAMKNYILYAFASSEGENRKGQKYMKFKYNPNDEFKW